MGKQGRRCRHLSDEVTPQMRRRRGGGDFWKMENVRQKRAWITRLLGHNLCHVSRSVSKGASINDIHIKYGIVFASSLLFISAKSILGLASTWIRGFVNNIPRFPLACLGSREAAEQLWNSHKTSCKTSYSTSGLSGTVCPQISGIS